MAVIACTIPAFPVALLARADPSLWARPLAVLDADERVLALTQPAQAAGVRPGQHARQARTACPDLLLHTADLPGLHTAHESFLAVLDDFTHALEPLAWGGAFLAAADAGAALPFCQQIGRRLRAELALTAAIGCDAGKFTAQAAAAAARAGAVRVVLGEDEQAFLRPLPVQLLPLGAEQQRLLAYLGLNTLGQFADLPPAAVFQQFGPAGRLAQRWARGQDDRPVIPRRRRPSHTRALSFDPPLDRLPALLAASERLLTPLLIALQDRLQAAQTLQAVYTFADGSQEDDFWRLTLPTAQGERLLGLLATRWQQKTWAHPLAGLSLTLGEVQETAGEQLLLFPGEGAPADLLADFLRQLRQRFGEGRFLQAEVAQPLLLRVEQRARWQEFGA
jgi:protein ImuB